MFRVDFRFAGSGLWTWSGGPSNAQAAEVLARALSDPQRKVETRIVPTAQSDRVVDLKA